MKITVINGTPQKGVTCFMKEQFLGHLRSENEIKEFYPKDLPPFCVGCKNCFLRGEDKCPHAAVMTPVWNAIMEADLLVFAYPVYALRAPASIKSLLDHMCVHWLVHRPEPEFFTKTAVILTNSVGAPNGSAQKDVKTSLQWMGLSKIYTCGAGMMGDIFIDTMTPEHRKMLADKTRALAEKVKAVKPRKRMGLKVKLLFGMAKMQHAMVLKAEEVPSLDNAHYIQHGWIRRKS
ncbi:MAG: flavodoxin family protein [Faecousia sp.]